MANYLIVLVGPTGIGKTKLSIYLAKKFNIEIINADSRQLYRGMDIGTSKPSFKDLSSVPHHLIDIVDPWDNYTIADYEKDSIEAIKHIFNRNNIALLVGGSGLYIKATCEGIDNIPPIPEMIRDELYAELLKNGKEFLLEELKQKDYPCYKIIDIKNPRRIIRALEVIRYTNKKFSSFLTHRAKRRDFQTLKIGIQTSRTDLYNRIDKRVEIMFKNKFLDEVLRLYKYKNYNSLQSIGYKEAIDFIDRKITKSEMISLIKRNTRRYAKRQITWFKKDATIKWFSNKDQVLNYIKKN